MPLYDFTCSGCKKTRELLTESCAESAGFHLCNAPQGAKDFISHKEVVQLQEAGQPIPMNWLGDIGVMMRSPGVPKASIPADGTYSYGCRK